MSTQQKHSNVIIRILIDIDDLIRISYFVEFEITYSTFSFSFLFLFSCLKRKLYSTIKGLFNDRSKEDMQMIDGVPERFYKMWEGF